MLHSEAMRSLLCLLQHQLSWKNTIKSSCKLLTGLYHWSVSCTLGALVFSLASLEAHKLRFVQLNVQYVFINDLATVPLTCAVHADDIKWLPWLCNP